MGKESGRLVALFALLGLALMLHARLAEDQSATAVQLFPFYEGGTWGYMDGHGEVVLPPCFLQAFAFSDGLARVQTAESLGYIDRHGKLVFTLPTDWRPLDWTRPFSEGLAAFSVKGKCGYFDRHGKVRVEPQFDDARDFSEGLAAVNIGAAAAGFPYPFFRHGGEWGFIDRSGRLVLPARFDAVAMQGFSDGLALVEVDNKFRYIARTGQVVLTPAYKTEDPEWRICYASDFSERMARITTWRGRQFYVGFIDKTGRFVIEPQFQEARGFAEGLAAVAVGKAWGYVDQHGRIAIRPQFEEAQDFSEGLAVVRGGERWCYIDQHGAVVLTGRFNDADGFRGGLARVHEGGRFVRTPDGQASWSGGAWFYLNRKGEKVRPCRPDEAKGATGFGKEFR